MPDYFGGITPISGPFPERNMGLGQGFGVPFLLLGFTFSGSEVKTIGWVTSFGNVNSDQWEDSGAWNVDLVVSIANHQISGRFRCVRLDKDKNVLQSGAFTSSQALSADRTFAPVSPAWTDSEENCLNRLAFEFEMTNASTMTQSVEFQMGNGPPDTDFTTDISQDVGSGCVPAPLFRKRNPNPIIRM